MALPMYLLKQTRTQLIKRGIQGGYIAPDARKARGLSEFVHDLAQRSFSLGPEPLSLDINTNLMNAVPTLTTASAHQSRPTQPTTMLNITGETLERYVYLARSFNLPEPDRPTQLRQKLASDFLNLVGYEVLVPGAWPSLTQNLGIPYVPPSLDNFVLDGPKDIVETHTYLISDTAWDHLISLARQLSYITNIVQPREKFSPKRDPRTMVGISRFLTELSYQSFVDSRPPVEADAPIPLTSEWRFADERRLQRTLQLDKQARENYRAIAAKFKIYPQIRFSETAFVGVVLEAIGLEFLTPVTLPSLTVNHGPSL